MYVEQSHVENVMLLRYTKSLVPCYYSETTPLNPARGNAFKKAFCGRVFGSHTCSICTNGAYTELLKRGNNCSDKQKKNTEEQ